MAMTDQEIVIRDNRTAARAAAERAAQLGVAHQLIETVDDPRLPQYAREAVMSVLTDRLGMALGSVPEALETSKTLLGLLATREERRASERAACALDAAAGKSSLLASL